MGVNREPGQSASGFRLFIDNKDLKNPPKLEDIVVGAKIIKGYIEYTVMDVMDDMMVKLEGINGVAIRSTIIDMTEICKQGTEYQLKDEV